MLCVLGASIEGVWNFELKKATEGLEINGLFGNLEDKATSNTNYGGHAYEISERNKYYKDHLCDILS